MKKIISILIVYIVTVLPLNAVVMKEGEFVKQTKELNKLKKELDEFYFIKEQEYKKNKSSLDSINIKIQKDLNEAKAVRAENQKILDEIKRTIVDKAMKLYAKMKPKLVKSILQKKIDDGDINEVFDIMVRLKEKRVMKLLKMFDTETSTKLMNMISQYKNTHQGEK
jgi:flagellar motility protein MotE (MotC chaperone)